jgi:lysophospholipase L1-like esterase
MYEQHFLAARTPVYDGRMRVPRAQLSWMSVALWPLLASCVFSIPARAQQFALHDRDTVVFYGDSITAQRLYTRFVEDFVLTRYPTLDIRFVNAGVAGDSVSGGYAGKMAERVQRDVAPFHPSMITVMLGMNDGGWGYYPEQSEAAFRSGYRALIAALRQAAPAANLTLIRPTPYDEITHGTEFPGYSKMIDKLAGDVSEIAAQLIASGDTKVQLVDFHGPLVEALERARATFPQLAPLIAPDRIHPSETGHWIMAATLMAAWHVDPVVSSVELDAAGVQVTALQRTKITGLANTASGLKWSEVDDALPLPFDFNNAMTPVLLGISNIADLDREMLRVNSLERGRYQLLIDSKPAGVFTQDELHSGINLALMKTPMVDQARDVDSTEEQRAALDRARFILSADVKPNPDSAAAEERLRQAANELAASVRKDGKPHAHEFELRKQ